MCVVRKLVSNLGSLKLLQTVIRGRHLLQNLMKECESETKHFFIQLLCNKSNSLLYISMHSEVLQVLLITRKLPVSVAPRGGGGGTLSVTDREVPPKSLRLQAVPQFLLKMYTPFRDVLSFWGFFRRCLRKISPRWQCGLT